MKRRAQGVKCEHCGKELRNPMPGKEHHFCARCWENHLSNPKKLSFSEPAHVPLLRSGAKRQITRAPRKVLLKAGDRMKCYFRPRVVKNTCLNCIVPRPCEKEEEGSVLCSDWNNYFGVAVVEGVTYVRPSDEIPEYEMGRYLPLFKYWDIPSCEKWAVDEGFSCFQEAKRFRSGMNSKSWDIIYFKPKWVA